MKICILVPWVVDDKTAVYLKEFLPNNRTEDVDVAGLQEGASTNPAGQKSSLAYSLPAYLEAMKDAERRGYDAIVIAGNVDPGIEEARELVDIPVVGPCMAATHMAFMLGHRLCMLSPIARWPWFHMERVVAYGFENRVVMRGIDYSPDKAIQAYEEYKASGREVIPFVRDIVAECVKAIEEDHCDVISFVCTALIWTKEPIERELAKKGYRPTVVQGLPTAVELARALVHLKLTHTRLAYRKVPVR